MEFANYKICRLCLKIYTGGQSLDEIVRSNLNSLQLYLNVSISREPKICTACIEALHQCLEFKAKCVSTEDHINSLMCNTNSEKVHPRDSYKTNVMGEDNVSLNEYDLCYFCLKLVHLPSSMTLKYDEKKMLQTYFPELEFDCTKRHVTCDSCYESIRQHLSFLGGCLNVEKQIDEFCRINGRVIKGQIDLNKVAKFAGTHLCIVNRDIPHHINVDTDEMKSAITTGVTCTENTDVKFSDCDVFIEEVEVKEEKDDAEDVIIDDEIEKETAIFQELTGDKVPKQRIYRCSDCLYTTKSHRRLYRHSLNRHILQEDQFSRYKCDECSFKTGEREHILQHLAVHSKLRNKLRRLALRKCEKCNRQFRSMKKLYMHRNVIHIDTVAIAENKVEEKPVRTKKKMPNRMFLCERCGHLTTRRYDLNVHLRSHENRRDVKKYKCSECPFEPRTKAKLKAHMNVHK